MGIRRLFPGEGKSFPGGGSRTYFFLKKTTKTYYFFEKVENTLLLAGLGRPRGEGGRVPLAPLPLRTPMARINSKTNRKISIFTKKNNWFQHRMWCKCFPMLSVSSNMTSCSFVEMDEFFPRWDNKLLQWLNWRDLIFSDFTTCQVNTPGSKFTKLVKEVRFS